MRASLASLLVGVLFGAGLALSNMMNPARVLAFLDIAGDWDPSLLLVMVGAMVPSGIGYWLSRRRKAPAFAAAFFMPALRDIDGGLLLGSAMFGVGWGLVGLCPGPALAGLVLGRWEIWLFIVAMLAGMLVHRLATGAPALARLDEGGRP